MPTSESHEEPDDEISNEEWFHARAAQGSRELYDAALAAVPDVEPDEWDRFPTV
jgi:hypothetical protein